MSEEQRVNEARAFLYRLAKSFFVPEPDEERLRVFREVLAKLPAVDFEPFDRAVENLREALSRTSAKEMEEEFFRLFLDPFAEDRVALEASAYLDGKPFGPSLARLRGFLAKEGLAKGEEVKEPEDHLVLLLDFMEALIGDGKDLISQRELFYNYLRPCVAGVAKSLREKEAGLFQAVADFLEGLLALEERFLSEEA